MSLTGSMYTAANGLNAHGEAINVVSDNIANINTTGFKQSQSRFADVIATTVGDAGGAGTQGQGSRLASSRVSFTQGTLLPTGRNTDLALQGNGFFMVQGTYGGAPGTFFTRNGSFGVDNEGYLVNSDRLIVQGFPVNETGQLMTSVASMKVGGTNLVPPKVTDEIVVRANLDSDGDIISSFDLTQPAVTSTFGASVTCYDSRGAERNIDMYFCNVGGNQFEWHALAQGKDVSGGTPGVATEVGTGKLTFNTDGSLNTFDNDVASVDFEGANPGQQIKLAFGTPTAAGGTGRDGVSSYAGASNITYIAQDGYAEGAFVGISVNDQGDIIGAFTNGQPRLLGRLAVATFADQESLQRTGGTLFTANSTSGLPAVGPPSVGGRGSIVSGSLEQSNVNLSQEFVNLMSYQRGFEANTRSIKAADQMLQELVNLTR